MFLIFTTLANVITVSVIPEGRTKDVAHQSTKTTDGYVVHGTAKTCIYCNFISVGLKDLLKELQQVTDWYKLGLHLDIPEHKLIDIQETNSGNTEDCRRDMVIVWMESEVATWARVVHALIHIEQPVLATNIASKYGK